MLGKDESPLRVGRENIQKHSRTSSAQTSGADLHSIPRIEWSCPCKFEMDPRWEVKAGEESEEVKKQQERQLGVAEAVYLRSSNIPDNPSVAPDADCPFPDDSSVPLIPLVGIDEETDAGDGTPVLPLSPIVREEGAAQSVAAPALSPPVTERSEAGTTPHLQRDEVMGAAVALAALIKSKEPGSNIDLEFLIRLLRNPGMLEKLMKEHGLSLEGQGQGASSSHRSTVTSVQPRTISSVPLPVPRPTMEIRPPRSELGSFAAGFAPLSVPGPKMVTERLPDIPIGTRTMSALPQESSTVPLLIPRPIMEIRQLRIELSSVAAGSATLPIPGPRITAETSANVPIGSLTTSVQFPERSSFPLPSPRPTMEPMSALGPVSAGVVPHSVPGPHVASVPASASHHAWTPSVPFIPSRSQYIKNIVDQIHAQSQSGQSMAVAPMPALPGSRNVDVEKIRRLVNEYGDPIAAQPSKPGSSPLFFTTSNGPIVFKDSNYHRNLILQHGTMQESLSPQGSLAMTSMSPAETGLQEQRPCIYFNSPGGCRRGPNCRFQHTMPNMGARNCAMEEPSAKRRKPFGRNFGEGT